MFPPEGGRMGRISLIGIFVFSALLSVHAIDPVIYKQIKVTTGDFLCIYSSNYNDDAWGNENFGRIYHPGFHRETKLPEKLKSLGLRLDLVKGLKIYTEVQRKDLQYLKENDSYLVRHDFTVAAVLDGGRLQVQKPAKIVSQYLWLEKDRGDRNLYKIIDVYPTIMTDEFLFKESFLEHSAVFTKDANVVKTVKNLK